MKTSALDLFFDNTTLTNTANAKTTSEVLDWRMHGPDFTKDLVINAYLRNAKLQSAGAMTIKLQGSDNGTGWTDLVVVSKGLPDVDGNNCIAKIPLGGVKLMQFHRLEVTVTTPFTVAPTVFAGLDQDTDYGMDQGHVDWNNNGLAGGAGEQRK